MAGTPAGPMAGGGASDGARGDHSFQFKYDCTFRAPVLLPRCWAVEQALSHEDCRPDWVHEGLKPSEALMRLVEESRLFGVYQNFSYMKQYLSAKGFMEGTPDLTATERRFNNIVLPSLKIGATEAGTVQELLKIEKEILELIDDVKKLSGGDSSVEEALCQLYINHVQLAYRPFSAQEISLHLDVLRFADVPNLSHYADFAHPTTVPAKPVPFGALGEETKHTHLDELDDHPQYADVAHPDPLAAKVPSVVPGLLEPARSTGTASTVYDDMALHHAWCERFWVADGELGAGPRAFRDALGAYENRTSWNSSIYVKAACELRERCVKHASSVISVLIDNDEVEYPSDQRYELLDILHDRLRHFSAQSVNSLAAVAPMPVPGAEVLGKLVAKISAECDAEEKKSDRGFDRQTLWRQRLAHKSHQDGFKLVKPGRLPQLLADVESATVTPFKFAISVRYLFTVLPRVLKADEVGHRLHLLKDGYGQRIIHALMDDAIHKLTQLIREPYSQEAPLTFDRVVQVVAYYVHHLAALCSKRHSWESVSANLPASCIEKLAENSIHIDETHPEAFAQLARVHLELLLEDDDRAVAKFAPVSISPDIQARLMTKYSQKELPERRHYNGVRPHHDSSYEIAPAVPRPNAVITAQSRGHSRSSGGAASPDMAAASLTQRIAQPAGAFTSYDDLLPFDFDAGEASDHSGTPPVTPSVSPLAFAAAAAAAVSAPAQIATDDVTGDLPLTEDADSAASSTASSPAALVVGSTVAGTEPPPRLTKSPLPRTAISAQ